MAGRLFGGDLVVTSPQVLHERVTRCDGLGGAVSLEAAHRSEPGLEPTVIGLDPVVRVPLDTVQRVRDQLVQDTRVSRRPIGGDLHRDGSGAQHAGKELPRSRQITPGAEQDVDDLTVLVDRAVQIPPLAGYLQVGLVDEPPVPRAVPARPGSLDKLGGESLHPPVDTHVINRDTALSEQLLHIAVRQAVPQVPAHRHRDTSRGNRNPANAEDAPDEVTGSVSQGRPLAQRNRAFAAASGLATPSVADERYLPTLKARFFPLLAKVMFPNALTEIVGMTEAVTGSTLDWTLARITNPTDKPPKGTLRAGYLGWDKIGWAMARADIAGFLVAQLNDTTYLKAAPAISN